MSVTDETDETPDTAVRGAQTVAPVQASALLFAASILGEASYTPDQELKGTLHTPARVHEEEAVAPAPVAPAPVVAQPVVAQPVVAQPVVPEPVVPEPVVQPPAPVVQAPRSAGVVPPAPVPAAPAAPVAEPVKKGFFARLIDKLLGR